LFCRRQPEGLMIECDEEKNIKQRFKIVKNKIKHEATNRIISIGDNGISK